MQTREKLVWEERERENSYYILLPRKANLLEAEKLMCVGHKASLMGRPKQLRDIRKTSLTWRVYVRKKCKRRSPEER